MHLDQAEVLDGVEGLHDYSIFRADRRGARRATGGVMLLVRKANQGYGNVEAVGTMQDSLRQLRLQDLEDACLGQGFTASAASCVFSLFKYGPRFSSCVPAASCVFSS